MSHDTDSTMLSAALDWYYGSNEEFLLANCQFGEPFPTLERKHHKNLPNVVVRPGSFENGSLVNIFTVARKKKKHPTHLEESAKVVVDLSLLYADILGSAVTFTQVLHCLIKAWINVIHKKGC